MFFRKVMATICDERELACANLVDVLRVGKSVKGVSELLTFISKTDSLVRRDDAKDLLCTKLHRIRLASECTVSTESNQFSFKKEKGGRV
ncbi:hypothetical protein P5673_018737 [Acropora cervicornis]|uniref:Uncharacterized protein n=1 Tax=Acropora cervicornis TaxID=6130 RepID=A0AAD9QC38_ACRCE|nr:hypothetical protein P5673_018737 [Acropora cervicornis]